MSTPKIAPYGSWKSPITSELIVSDMIGFDQLALDGETVYWIESRPAEGGRSVIVRQDPDGITTDLNPAPFNARSRVHEMGGGAMAVANGVVFFSNFADQRLYRIDPGAAPRALTADTGHRFADAVVDRDRGRLVTVLEDHGGNDREPDNLLASLSVEDGENLMVLASGNDFYSSPRLSPDGRRLAYLTWNHPNRPWDGTELWVLELNPDGSPGQARQVAGGVEESVFQPQWSPDGELYFVSDRSGWWNLYRERDGIIQPLVAMDAEFGLPQWVCGMSTYGFESARRLICAYKAQGCWRLAALDTASLALETLDIPYTEIEAVRAAPGQVVFLGASSAQFTAVVRLYLKTQEITELRQASRLCIDPAYLSMAEPVTFPTTDGREAHGFYYPPRNRDFQAPDRERPPLIVKSHGGPTGSADSRLNLGIQYWSSRGFAVLDVNYGGSTGYGRAYRERLDGQWGVVDVDDCVNGALYLVKLGEVDRERLIIRGGSAGGYTTLAALTFRDVFKAGASHYGVSDLEALAQDTHKFESRYLDRLIGPYPERRDVYLRRSPIHHVEKLSCPVIFFQGLEDRIVPPNQSQAMADALRAKGLAVAYLPFEGEQHGFRQGENIRRALDGELYFYSRVFGFELAEYVDPVSIHNLD